MKTKLLLVLLLIGLHYTTTAQVAHDYKPNCCRLAGATFTSEKSCYCAGCAAVDKKNAEAKAAEDKRVQEVVAKKEEEKKQKAIAEAKKQKKELEKKAKESKANVVHLGVPNNSKKEVVKKGDIKESGNWVMKRTDDYVYGFVDVGYSHTSPSELEEKDWKIKPNAMFVESFGRGRDFDVDDKYALVGKNGTFKDVTAVTRSNPATIVINRKGEIINECSNTERFVKLKEPFALKIFDVYHRASSGIQGSKATLINIENNKEFKQFASNYSSEYDKGTAFWTNGFFEINEKYSYGLNGASEYNTDFVEFIRKELRGGYHTALGFPEGVGQYQTYTYLLIKKDGSYKEVNGVSKKTIFK